MSDLPLQGVRVIDSCIYWAGPMATVLLADLGAEVIKVESVQRIDFLRLLGGWPTPDGYEWSAVFNGANRNKHGITLNLNSEKGRDVFRRLVAVGDVVTENFSPRVMENWGLAYKDLAAIKSDIVMLSMPGFGTTGPLRNYVTFGPNVEMISGMPIISGYPGGGPMMTGYIADPAAGLMGAVAVMVALEHKKRIGEGQHIDLSQMEAMTTFMGEALMDFTMNGRVRGRRGNRHHCEAPYGVYPCKGDDQWVTITVSSDEEWARFCEAIGNPHWTKDPRFATGPSRCENHDELDGFIGDWTMQREKQRVMSDLQNAGIAAASVLTYADIMSDAHILDRGFFEQVTRPVNGTHPLAGFPAKFSKTPLSIRRPAPTVGQDTEHVLKTVLNMPDSEIAQLAEEEVIGTKPHGWPYAMDEEEAISRLKGIHGKD